MALVSDKVRTRFWELDLSIAGQVYSPKKRPANRKRQKIARFVGREGTVESFSVFETFPYPGHEEFSPPSQAQYGAVSDFFSEVCETRYQASTMLSAKDYAEFIAKGFSFTAPRRHFLWFCTTAFILSNKDLRSVVRSWNIAQRGRSPSIASGGIYLKSYKQVAKFAARLIDDMRGEGAEIFG